ncbi:MAG: ABC transporter permease [Spirochaetaceae bacterium]|nr:MAG: ABC transporter permease [Spirochaetaceae bacterium]
MWSRIIGRAGRLVLTVFVVATITFVIIRVVPGDPAALVAGLDADPQTVARIRTRMGTDRPLSVQYISWMGSILRFDLGTSLVQNRPVAELLLSRVPVTFALAGSALLFSLLVAIPLGVAAASSPKPVYAHLCDVYTNVGLSIPDFWAGILLLLAFSVRFRWFPLFGVEGFASYVLPTVALGLSRSAFLARVVRRSVRDELSKPYVEGARSLGISGRRLIVGEVLPNALLPTITIAAVQFGYLLGGAIVVEQVFSMPGLGRLILNAVSQRDFPVVQAGVVFVAAAFSLINFFADVLYSLLNPRIRY